MAQARVAAGAITAVLLIGAVMHFQPVHKLSAESFASAALDIETLESCKAQVPSSIKTNPAGEAGPALITACTHTDTCSIYVEKDGPCVCKNSICTNGRVCNSAGATGQCYLPRCPPAGTNVMREYTAGCFCADTSAFTSSDKANGYVGSGSTLPTKACAADAVATEDCKCGDNPVTEKKPNVKQPSFCYKGQTCTKADAAVGMCDGKVVIQQNYYLAVPSISSNAFTDATKFAICKSTAHTTRECTLPAAPVTQQGTQASPTCTVKD